MRENFAWFEGLLTRYLSLRIVLIKGRSWREVLNAFGLDPASAVEETLQAQMGHPDQPTVRAGEHEGWAYAIQDTWDPNDKQLERLSVDGEAFELAYTPLICPFGYATAGDFVSGFDMTVPHGQWGDERLFAAELAEAGFLDPGVPRPGVMGPRFVQLAFGLTITPAMVEGPLPSAARPSREQPEPPRPAPQPPPPIRPGLR